MKLFKGVTSIMENGKNVLALYDFASKQEYIYRTSKIKEISGASALMSGMYKKFVDILSDSNITPKYDVDSDFSLASFENDGSSDGEVLYDGGGNLMVIWKSREIFKKANRVISVYLLKNVPGLTMISCCVDVDEDFEKNRSELYAENALRKSTHPAFDMPAVTPFTQIDPTTFLPVTHKITYKDEQVSQSSDRFVKTRSYSAIENSKSDLNEDEGMLAVIYIDGNSMGNKLIACKSDDYDEGVRKLRSFSKQVNEYYVEKPVKDIETAGYVFRQIIGGGDEITLMCKAEDAFKIMQIYFDSLNQKTIKLDDNSFTCTSCAGIAVFHAKSPFNIAYNIAEAACEQAKEKAHKKDGNYFSFYYCHGSITNVFDILHKNEQEHTSGKPYDVEEIYKFKEMRKLLNMAGRANVKSLGTAAQKSRAEYKFEIERINAYLPKGSPKLTDKTAEMKLVYDMAEFYDLWFAKEEKDDEKNA